MDAAGKQNWCTAVAAQGQLVGEQQQQWSEVEAKLNLISQSSPLLLQHALPSHH